MPEFHFVDSCPKEYLSPRSRSLQLTHLRSHAAILSHRARKAGCSKDPKRASGPYPWRKRTPADPILPDCEDEEPVKKKASNVGRRRVRSSVWAPEFAYSAPSLRSFGAVWSWASEALDYFTHASIPFHVPVHKIFDVRIVMAELYSESTRYDAPGHAAMAYTQSVLDRVRQPGQKPSLAVLRNVNVAITGVRQYLTQVKNQPSTATILAVVAMNILARITGDNAALRVHNKILVPLVQARGGVNVLESESVLGMFILHWESAFNLRTGSDPEILFPNARPPAILSYSPVSIELQTLVDQLPRGFRRLQSHFSVYTLEVLVRAARVAESGSLKSLPDTPARYRDFWEACPCLMSRDRLKEPKLEKLVVQALILYCFFTFSESRVASMTFAGVRTTLGASVVDRVGGNDDERAALVWCWMCLIDSWTDSRRRLLPEGWLLVTQMRHAFSEIEDAEEVLSKLRLFFSNKAFEERCRGHWDGPEVGGPLSMRP